MNVYLLKCYSYDDYSTTISAAYSSKKTADVYKVIKQGESDGLGRDVRFSVVEMKLED